MKRNAEREKGFTLVELIVVLVILGILASMLVPALTGYIDKARDQRLIQLAKSLHTAAQTVASETYAKGAYQISGSGDGTKLLNMPSIKEIISLSEMRDWGNPGNDWKYNNKDYAIYNGFGYKGNGSSTPVVKARYHFKTLIGADGKVQGLVVCDGMKSAVLKDGAFEIHTSTCSVKHENGQLYNYLFIDQPNTSAKTEYDRLLPYQ